MYLLQYRIKRFKEKMIAPAKIKATKNNTCLWNKIKKASQLLHQDAF